MEREKRPDGKERHGGVGKAADSRRRRNDVLLAAGILVVALAVFLGYHIFYATEGSHIIVTVDGQEYARLPLYQDKIIDIPSADGSNRLQIKDGYADMLEADCPDGLCVRQKKISKKGETIVCLPHKIVVEVIAGEENDLDGIAS